MYRLEAAGRRALAGSTDRDFELAHVADGFWPVPHTYTWSVLPDRNFSGKLLRLNHTMVEPEPDL